MADCHSTAAMNILTATRIIVCYPELTFLGLSLQRTSREYAYCAGVSVDEWVKEYESLGIKFVVREGLNSSFRFNQGCLAVERDIDDKFCYVQPWQEREHYGCEPYYDYMPLRWALIPRVSNLLCLDWDCPNNDIAIPFSRFQRATRSTSYPSSRHPDPISRELLKCLSLFRWNQTHVPPSSFFL